MLIHEGSVPEERDVATTATTELALRYDLQRVIWDWNGTLLDDVSLVVDIMGELLREHGLPALDVARYLEIFEFPTQKYYQKLGFGPAHPSFETLATRFMEQYERRVLECSLHAGAGEALERFRERGIANVILTAGKQTSVERQLKHFGLRELVTEVVGSGDHFAGPKDALAFNWLRERQFVPQSMVYIGDTVHDFEVATSMRVRCVLVPHGHNSLRRLQACRCTVASCLGALWRD
jgi:phosphoglycolate phosphatase